MQARTITSRLAVAIYFAVVLVPVFLLGHDGPWFGPGDISIRGRAPFPDKFSPGAFAAFDEWFADRVGFRYPLIYAGTNFHLGLLHRPIDRHIVFGQDGWMFWSDDRDIAPATMADARGRLRFTPAEVKRIDANMRAAHAHFAACGVPSAVFIAPNKQSIYGEFLIRADAGAPATRVDALIEELSPEAKAMIIDPRPKMRAAKLAHAPLHLYNKTETHWNLLGAFYGALAAVEHIGRKMPLANRELASLEHYRISVMPYAGGDMAQRVLFSPWRFPDEDVLLEGQPPISNATQVQIDGAHFVERNPRGEGRLVIIGDSFATLLMPFLSQHFAEVHRYAGQAFDGAVLPLHRPDFVILETLESHSPRLLLPPINLEAGCGS